MAKQPLFVTLLILSAVVAHSQLSKCPVGGVPAVYGIVSLMQPTSPSALKEISLFSKMWIFNVITTPSHCPSTALPMWQLVIIK